MQQQNSTDALAHEQQQQYQWINSGDSIFFLWPLDRFYFVFWSDGVKKPVCDLSKWIASCVHLVIFVKCLWSGCNKSATCDCDCGFKAHKPHLISTLLKLFRSSSEFLFLNVSFLIFISVFAVLSSCHFLLYANWHVYNAWATSTWDAICKHRKPTKYHIIMWLCGC